MARKRRKSRKGSRRRRGMGSIIRVSRLGGFSDPRTGLGATLPVLLGGGVAIAVAVGIRNMVEPTTESDVSMLKNAPLYGGAAGMLVGGILFAMKMQPQGLAAVAGSVISAGAMWGLEKAAEMKAEALLEAATAAPAAQAAAGLRAVVPEYSMRGLSAGRQGMGLITMEPQASRGYGAGPLGAYGETVNLGAINPGAFGTPGFHFAGSR